MKKSILKIIQTKNKRPLVCLTAYSKPVAKILDKYCDIILVGDSLATAMYGMKNTHQISLETMIQHGISVSSSSLKALCVIDMPSNTYRSIGEATKNAKLIVKRTGCDAVKMECNGKNYKIIESVVKLGIPVMGHIGFTPQYYKKFKFKGLLKKERTKLIKEAKENERAGVFSIVIECVTPSTAKEITESLKIPTIGIGASKYCDGQILVTDDMLGLSGFYPKFVKKFARLNNIIEKGVQKYNKAVLTKKFPSKKNTF
ncbi:3-methyl-2-oxobutanoate hydroxymethyltransferase [Pelagibacteraceae bacterium]|nr:3-methyl-2-oxobutanoate hydroxymethyltransferase [Pelagibacteraceae bacterium]